MKKTLVALAALAATSAFAQSSVTVYGIVDVAYQSGTQESAVGSATPTKTKVSGMANSTLAGSRLGFKGTEDIGNGLKANFVAEMSLNALGDGFGNKTDGALAQAGNASTDSLNVDNTGATKGITGIFNRQTWAGLSGGFGEVRAGYMNALQYDHNANYSAGFEGMAGGRNHLDVLAGAYIANVATNAESNRMAGATYFAPTMGGVSLAAQWGANQVNQENGTQAGINTKGSHSSVGATYAQGPLSVGAVYGTFNAKVAAAALLSTAKEVKSSSTVYGASYDLTVAKLFAYYGDRKTTADALDDVKVSTMRYGVHVPVGNTKLIASYGTLTGKQDGVKYSDRKFYQVGALQSLSKRTTVFALYGSDKDDQSLAGLNTATNSAGGGAAVAKALDITTFRVGINHSF